MALFLAPSPKFQAFAANGGFLIGGQLFTYAAGTSTPQATYTDSTGGTPNTNPIILNSFGQANVWLTDGQGYKFVLEDSAGNILWTVDQIFGTPQPGAGNVSQGSGIASWPIDRANWSPVLTPGTGSIAQSNLGVYSRFANATLWSANISWSSTTGASGGLTINNFPVAPTFIAAGMVTAGFNGITVPSGYQLTMQLTPGLTNGILQFSGVAGGTSVLVSNIASSGLLLLGGIYT